jgi:F0F1-type ATP synthase assembly protein I
MEHADPNPIFVGLLFLVRCAVPLGILFGISYILRRLGLVAEPPDEKSSSGEAKNGK